MPSVNLSADTYEKLKDYAARHGTSTDEAAEWLLLRARTALLTPEQWNAEFDRLRARVQASIPDDVTEEEIQADIDRACARCAPVDVRAVVDTNLWISSLLSRRGAPARIAAAAGDRLTPVFTRSTFDELMRVASSERLVKRGLAPELFEVLAQRLLAVGEFIPEPPVTSITRDADDDVFVAAAVAGHAEFLVSGDGDLRDDPPVRGFLAERGVRIVTVREFVEILRESDSLG